MSINSFHFADYPNAHNDIPLKTKLGNGAIVESFSNHVVDQRRAIVSVQPSSASPTTLASLAGSQIDFRLENQCDRIDSMYLKLKIVNNSGAVCTFAHTDGFLQNVQLYADNGSTLLWQSTTTTENFLAHNMYLGRTEHENLADLRGTTPTYWATDYDLADTLSKYAYIPIALPFFSATKIRSFTIGGNFLVKLRFSSASNIITAGSADLNECSLILSGYYESEAQKKFMMSTATIPKVLPFHSFQRHSETLTMSGGSTYQIRLSGITGDVTCLAFCIRASADISSAANQFEWKEIQDWDLYDASNQSLTGFKRQTRQESLLQYALQFDNLFMLHSYAIVWSFSQSPVTDAARGTINGFINMGGFHSLSITPVSTLPSASYQIQVFALCQEEARIVNASISASRN